MDNPIDSASVYYYQDQVAVDTTLMSLAVDSYELSGGRGNHGAGFYTYVLRSGGRTNSRKMVHLDDDDGY